MKNVYFIGIGGIGMSALARYYNHQGCYVAGYDRTPSKLTHQLEAEGIYVHYQDSLSNIPERIKEDKEALVIYTPAIPHDSPELQWLTSNGYKIIKRSAALGHLASSKKCLAVAGTHGKTTTSTLLAHILEHSGEGCTAFLGGISVNYNTNLLLSRNNVLVAEADEFDRSFLQLWPQIAVITSADADHLDIYNDHSTIIGAFADFAAQVSQSGSLVVKKGIEQAVTSKAKTKVYTYSYDSPCDFYAGNLVMEEGGYFSFTLNYPGGSIDDCKVGIPGWINVENAVAASAVAILHGTDPQKVKEALAQFRGVRRRFELLLKTRKCAYIDDYAHHPKELSAALSSIRNIFPGKKITVVFQPHLYTRTRDFAQEFAQSLSLADELILLDIYPARELPIEGITSQTILKDVTLEEKTLTSKENLFEVLSNKKIEVLVTFGAGDIDRLTEPIAEYLKNRYDV